MEKSKSVVITRPTRKDLPADYVKEETEDIYMKRFCEPKEIARTILFLASDDASYITGTTLKVDGGHG